jgi:isopenicillin-N epimerase
MNLFARSFDLKEGDEIILADHEHPTGVNPYEYFCKPLGIKLVRPVLPFCLNRPKRSLMCTEEQ